MSSPLREPAPPFPRSHGVSLFLAALALRAALVLTTADDPVFATPMLDAEYAVEWANEVRNGSFWGSPEGTAYFRTPLYAWFLAGAFSLPGPDLPVARFLQALLGAFTAVLLAGIAGRRAGRAAAWTTGALAAGAWPLLLFGRELLIASVGVFLGAAVLRIWDGAGERSGPGRWLAIGLMIGLGGIARPNFLAFLPAALVLATLGPGRRGDWRRPLLLLAGTILIIAPISIRNHRVSGDPVVLSYQGGLNLWIGNHPDADGMSAVLPGFSSWRNDDVEALLAGELGRNPGPSEQDAWFRAKALKSMGENPGAMIRLLAKKTWLFLQGYEIRNNRDLYDLRTRSAILGLPLPDFGLVLPLALLGVWVAGRRRRELAPVLWFAATSAAAVILFFVCARYRLAAWPALLVLAGIGGAGLIEPGIPGRSRIVRAAVLITLVLAARIDPIGVRSPDPAQPRYQVGNVHARLGHWSEAEAEFVNALQISPGFSEARHHLGALYLRRGRPADALPHLRQAVDGMPRSFRARRSLAEGLEALGILEEAIAVRREAADLSAGQVSDRMALAAALGMARRYDEAWALYSELGREGADDDPWFELNAGQTALALKREGPGLELLERATRRVETRTEAWKAIATWHLSRRDPEKAMPVLSEALLHIEGDAHLHRLRAVARVATGDATGAVEDLRKVIALVPADEDSRRRLAEIENTLGGGGP